MVSIHIVPVIVCLIIKVISSTFRFKRGTACYIFAFEGPRKTQHTYRYTADPRWKPA